MAGRRRSTKAHRGRKRYETRPIGPNMVQATPAAVARALGGLPADLGWRAVSEQVVPILPRRRPMPAGAGDPVAVTLPPGIRTGFGLDIGPAFLHVSRSLLEDWGIGTADLAAAGLENLRRLVGGSRPRDLVRQAVADVSLRVLQTGLGCASALVLLPDELARIFGPDPQCLIAPMRDLLVSLPGDTDRELVDWLNEEFAAMDPNALALEAFVFEDGSLRYEPLRRSALA